jgi:hypothetical protein
MPPDDAGVMKIELAVVKRLYGPWSPRHGPPPQIVALRPNLPDAAGPIRAGLHGAPAPRIAGLGVGPGAALLRRV